MNSSCQETNVISSNTLYDELNYVKLEEVTHDKEKYRHKYKLVKKDLLNVNIFVKIIIINNYINIYLRITDLYIIIFILFHYLFVLYIYIGSKLY